MIRIFILVLINIKKAPETCRVLGEQGMKKTQSHPTNAGTVKVAAHVTVTVTL